MTTTLSAPATETCTLDIGGMTCASCVGRVEKALTQGRRRASTRRSTSPPRPPPSPTTRRRVGAADADRRRREGRLHRHAAPSRRDAEAPSAAAPTPVADDWTPRRDGELAGCKRKWQVALTTGLGLMGADVRAAATSTRWTG